MRDCLKVGSAGVAPAVPGILPGTLPQVSNPP